ncbi:prolyl oligopeptidase family serine peptidase [Ancylomarina longa]|uniref:Phospholipase n=1 Tax=Ancylomarina longa TaxID=2487017 RepID=A0A434AX69_9BACT|nr:prolyl oligopeptidase family serine peptidase [Ancylomarina longa]RUT79121.1 phospholipase [Ancylomarina longa]
MKKIILLLLCICFSISNSSAQSNRFGFEKFTGKDGTALNYRLLSPDYNTTRKFPLIVFLHGSGERGSDNEAQLKWGVLNFATDEALSLHPAFVIAPQCPKEEQWANYYQNDSTGVFLMKSTPSKSMNLLVDLIHQFVRTHAVDRNRIYITGLSMGGYGTYDAIERYPNLFAAAVPVCGAGDSSKAESIAHIPIWIFHGAEDPAVNCLYSLDMLNALVKAGAHPGFTQYPEVGHFSWLEAYSDKQMMTWLFRQHQ